FWPVLAARATGLVLVALAVAVFARRSHLVYPHRSARNFALAAGALDVAANVLELAAVRRGLLSVVAPVAALAPAFTVLWAWVVLREQLARAQFVGIVLALIGLVLVATG